jgi:hypothetical protein
LVPGGGAHVEELLAEHAHAEFLPGAADAASYAVVEPVVERAPGAAPLFSTANAAPLDATISNNPNVSAGNS